MDVVTAAAVCGGCRCRGGFVVRPTWADFTPAQPGSSGVLFPEIFKVVRHGSRWRPLAFRRSSSALAAAAGLPSPCSVSFMLPLSARFHGWPAGVPQLWLLSL